MASINHARNKQMSKSGGGGPTYVYKLDTGNLKKAAKEPAADSSSVKKGIIHSSISSWGLRRSKTVRETTVDERGRVKTGLEAADTKEVVVESRKSASSEAISGRKSVSQLEVNVAAVASFLQVKVLVTDMPGFMQVHAFRCARSTYDSLEKFSSKHMAFNIKKEFDKVYGPAWHCIVGSSFGSFVTHATGCFLYFSMEKLCILVFKTKVQRALDPS